MMNQFSFFTEPKFLCLETAKIKNSSYFEWKNKTIFFVKQNKIGNNFKLKYCSKGCEHLQLT